MNTTEIIQGVRWLKAKTNYLTTNNYFLDFGNKTIVDASLVPDEPVDIVILTHCHWDHIYNLHELVKTYKPKVLAGHRDTPDIENITEKVIPEHSDKELKPIRVDRQLKEGDKIDLGDLVLEVLETPGHTNGSISLWNEKRGLLFTGDTWFGGDVVGRWDLPSGSKNQIWESVKRLEKLDYRYLLPGHGAPLIRK